MEIQIIPLLEHGDRLNRLEFEKRSQEMTKLKHEAGTNIRILSYSIRLIQVTDERIGV